MPNFSISDLFSFEKMMAITLIKILYWIGIAVGALFVGGQILGAFAMMQWSFGSGLGLLVAAVFGAVFGLLAWRLICESMIVLFGIYDRLGDLRTAFSANSTKA